MAAGIPTIAEIQLAAAREYKLPRRVMTEPRPTHSSGANAFPVARARQVAIALADLLSNHSRVRIGHFFGGRHPATVRHASAVVGRRRKDDPVLHATMRRLTLELIHP